MSTSNTVALVVDPTFGARLKEVVAQMPVWIVDSPTNRPIAHQYWQEHPGESYLHGVTMFTADSAASRDEWCVGQLGAIDVHHGEHSYSGEPPYRAIQVYGVECTGRIAAAFAGYSLTVVTKTADGFLASRPNTAD